MSQGREKRRPLMLNGKHHLNVDHTRILVAKGKIAVHLLDVASRQAVILQHKTLSELLEENRDTEYGRRYGFSGIHTAKEYKKRVPLTEYTDYRPYIRRMMEGETCLLSAHEPKHFAVTSGSAGEPKYIPVSQRELDKYVRYSAEFAFGVADEYYRNTTGKGVPAGRGLNAVEMRILPTRSGTGRGTISSRLMRSLRSYVPSLLSAPWEVINSWQNMDMKYLKTRLALADRDLVFMDAAFMSSLVDLMDYIRDHYEKLCRDIYHGRINEKKVPKDVRDELLPYITPDPKRARELLREFREGFESPIIPRIWPRMSWIGGIGTGGFVVYAKRMRKYSGKSIPFTNLCYAASESFIAAARHMGDESFVLIPDGGFYEFVPVSNQSGGASGADMTQTLNIDELEVGEDYRIIVTNLSGFYRYQLQDVVRVTGYYNESPMLRFLYRENQLISMAGEKTNEEQIRWAVERFHLETGISVTDYSVYASSSTSPGHYVLLIEPGEAVPETYLAYCRDVLEQKMMQANPSYGEKIRAGVLGEMELVFLQQQTYQLYRDLQVMKGASVNQLKPVRVIETPQMERFFFGLKEHYPHQDAADSE